MSRCWSRVRYQQWRSRCPCIQRRWSHAALRPSVSQDVDVLSSAPLSSIDLTSSNFPPAQFLYNLDELPLLSSLSSTLAESSNYYYETLPPISLPAPLFPNGAANKPRVAVAVSGGVDSSVSAFLLREAGYDVHGIYMQNWDELDETGICTGEQDLRDAEVTCDHLRIPAHRVNFVRDYWMLVFEDLLAGYQHGFTPNPDVICNREIKFSLLLKHVQEKMGISTLATGHYARTQKIYTNRQAPHGTTERQDDDRDNDIPYNNGSAKQQINEAMEYLASFMKQNRADDSQLILHTPGLFQHPTQPQHSINDSIDRPDSAVSRPVSTRLLISADPRKDQTYFLSLIRSAALPHLLFPLGSFTKSMTRMIADYAELPTAKKADSMGICMIGRRRFSSFLANYLTLTPGYFITLDGQRLAQHSGMEQYTEGQGAHIGGMTSKYYICKKHVHTGDVMVVQDRLHPALLYDTVYVQKMNWISGQLPKELHHEGGTLLCYTRLRSTEPLRRCTIARNQQISSASPPASLLSALAEASIIHATSDLSNQYLYKITFLDMPHHLVSPGQTIAFYLDNCCLGGGPVAAAGPSYYEMKKSYILPSS